MAYRVVETVLNKTSETYSSTEDFLTNGYREGRDRQWWVDMAVNKLTAQELATEAERTRFLAIDSDMTVTYGDWNAETQSVVKTRTYTNEADFDFAEEIYTRAFPREYDSAGWGFANKEATEI